MPELVIPDVECLAAQLLRAHDRLRTTHALSRAYEIPSSALALHYWWRAARRRVPWWRRVLARVLA
jgi:hypothetical protein